MTAKVERGYLAVLLLLAGLAYVSRLNPVVRQADPAAYYRAGLAIAEVGSPRFCDENNSAVGPYFTLLGFKVNRHAAGPCLYANISIGLPLLIALARSVAAAPEAVRYLMPILGLMGIVALYSLGRELFDGPTALLAAGFLALSFRYWYGATEIWSDVPALALLLAGILFFVRVIDQDDPLQGVLGGIALGYACLIRYTSVVALLPLSLYAFSATRGQVKPKRGLAAFCLGLGMFALAIGAYNRLVYGGFLTTGYSPDHGYITWPAFSYSYFWGGSPIDMESGYRAVCSSLVESVGLVGVLVALVTMVIMPRAKALLLGGVAVAFSALPAFYAWAPTGVNARLLLPAFAMIYLAIAFGIVRFLRLLLQERKPLLVLALPLIILAWHLPSFGTSALKLERRNRRTEDRVTLVTDFTQATEDDAVFISREYHDLIILYGQRAALHYSLIAARDPVSWSYQLAGYEGKLVEVVSRLLQDETPVYLVVEPETRSFREGPIDPYPILSARFKLSPFRADPAIYQVLMP